MLPMWILIGLRYFYMLVEEALHPFCPGRLFSSLPHAGSCSLVKSIWPSPCQPCSSRGGDGPWAQASHFNAIPCTMPWCLSLPCFGLVFFQINSHNFLSDNIRVKNNPHVPPRSDFWRVKPKPENRKQSWRDTYHQNALSISFLHF